MTTAVTRWREDLASWALPASITDAVDESPWELPADAMVRRVAARVAEPSGPSLARTAEALPGTVLDVGAGAGAASLPVAKLITELTAVDESGGMLTALTERAAALGVATTTRQGRWPDIASTVDIADVVVCHHVFYNVADLPEFVSALDSHARRRTVVELSERHPMWVLNRYWQRLHGLNRPDRPTAADAIAVVREAGFNPTVERWTRQATELAADFDAYVANTGRALCLPAHRRDELVALIKEFGVAQTRDVVTLWWDHNEGPS